ncbi:MAG: mechanosensitive ion channel family protein [Gemmatimonadaceae bacterium]
MTTIQPSGQPDSTLAAIRRRFIGAVMLLAVAAGPAIAWQARAQAVQSPPVVQQKPPNDTLSGVVEKVRIDPAVSDGEIRARLIEIISATGRFPAFEVRVQNGVVFLEGESLSADDRRWAGELARNTEGVAAVMNHVDVSRASVWDLKPALEGLRNLAASIVNVIPYLVVGVVVLFITILLAKLTTRLARSGFSDWDTSPLLRDLAAKGAGLLILLAGLFVIFRVAGLTTIALTVVGGTGLIGIILGIAFREISENLLASVFLSVQHPFRTGDLVEIEDVTGYVQRLTMRATLLMTLDGNHVQIPNSTVYRSILRNYTSNPNRRDDFLVGIGYDDSVPEAQEAALAVLAEHPAVLKDPEPWVLVDNLGQSTVNLRVYFWLDGTQHSWLKVRSSVIRLVKRAFQERGISMPDEARELIFPKGVPVTVVHADADALAGTKSRGEATAAPEDVATDAEAGLRSDAGQIKEQARTSRAPEEGADLLKD